MTQEQLAITQLLKLKVYVLEEFNHRRLTINPQVLLEKINELIQEVENGQS